MTPVDSGQAGTDAASDVTREDSTIPALTGGIGGKTVDLMDAGRPKDASAGGDSEDKGEKDSGASFSHIDAAPDAPVTFFDGDAGPTPPPYCVAPCVWEVVRHCIPTLDTCIVYTAAGALADGGNLEMTCDPNTGWAEFHAHVRLHTWEDGVSRNGITCFSWEYGFIPRIPPSRSLLYDSSGSIIATRFDDVMLCGDFKLSDVFFDGAPHFTDGGVELVDGGVAEVYETDKSLPECAAWDATGLPVAPPCSTTRSGTCP
jgi:hypothetical protein